MTTHYFIETDFDSIALALQARDHLTQKLIEQGQHCRPVTLYRATDGVRVFALEASEPEHPTEVIPAKSRRPRTGRTSRRTHVAVK